MLSTALSKMAKLPSENVLRSSGTGGWRRTFPTKTKSPCRGSCALEPPAAVRANLLLNRGTAQ